MTANLAPWARRALANDLPGKSYDRFAPATGDAERAFWEPRTLNLPASARLDAQTEASMIDHREIVHAQDRPGCPACDQIAGRVPVDHRQWARR